VTSSPRMSPARAVQIKGEPGRVSRTLSDRHDGTRPSLLRNIEIAVATECWPPSHLPWPEQLGQPLPPLRLIPLDREVDEAGKMLAVRSGWAPRPHRSGREFQATEFESIRHHGYSKGVVQA